MGFCLPGVESPWGSKWVDTDHPDLGSGSRPRHFWGGSGSRGVCDRCGDGTRTGPGSPPSPTTGPPKQIVEVSRPATHAGRVGERREEGLSVTLHSPLPDPRSPVPVSGRVGGPSVPVRDCLLPVDRAGDVPTPVPTPVVGALRVFPVIPSASRVRWLVSPLSFDGPGFLPSLARSPPWQVLGRGPRGGVLVSDRFPCLRRGEGGPTSGCAGESLCYKHPRKSISRNTQTFKFVVPRTQLNLSFAEIRTCRISFF